MKRFVIPFEEDTTSRLVGTINQYATDNNVEIVSVSYQHIENCLFSEQAVVLYERK